MMDSLQVFERVIFKKRQGELSITPSEVSWSLSGSSNNPFIKIQYNRISEQVVNPSTSDRAMLKLVLSAEGNGDGGSGSNSTVLFTFADGFSVRDNVNRIILEFKSGKRVDSKSPRESSVSPSSTPFSIDWNICGMAIANNPSLQELYQNLVSTGLIEEEEFWSQRQNLLEDLKSSLTQESGLSSSVLAELRPQATTTGSGNSNQNGGTVHGISSTGISEIKLVLTPGLIAAIFKLYPAVKKAYDTLVPVTWSEKVFWEKYVQSRFFYEKSSSGSGSDASSMANDAGLKMLRDCLDEEERAYALLLERKRTRVSALVDLWSTVEDNPSSRLEEDEPTDPNNSNNKGNEKNLSTIRKLNVISKRIVQTGIIPESESKKPKVATENKADWNSIVQMEDLQRASEPAFIPLSGMDKSHGSRRQATSDSSHSVARSCRNAQALAQELVRASKSSFQANDTLPSFPLDDIPGQSVAALPEANETNASNASVESFYRQAKELLTHFWSTFITDRSGNHSQAVLEKRSRLYNSLLTFSNQAPSLTNLSIESPIFKRWKISLSKAQQAYQRGTSSTE